MLSGLPKQEAEIIRFALGLDYQDRPFRLHYVAPKEGCARATCERLADAGFLTRGDIHNNGMRWFFVTERGAAAVGQKLPGGDDRS